MAKTRRHSISTNKLTTAAGIMSHGLDQSLIRLNAGELPRELLHAKRAAWKYRRQLEEAVTAQHGRVGIRAAHDIDLAVGAETVAAIARWLLVNRWKEMAIAEANSTAASILKAKQVRNQAVDRLRLDIDDSNTLSLLYGEPIAVVDNAPAAPQNAPDAPPAPASPTPDEVREAGSSEPAVDVVASEPYPSYISDR